MKDFSVKFFTTHCVNVNSKFKHKLSDIFYHSIVICLIPIYTAEGFKSVILAKTFIFSFSSHIFLFRNFPPVFSPFIFLLQEYRRVILQVFDWSSFYAISLFFMQTLATIDNFDNFLQILTTCVTSTGCSLQVVQKK